MNEDKKKAAYKVAVYEAVMKYLASNYVKRDVTAPFTLICEDVIYKDRVVPQDTFLEVLAVISSLKDQSKKEYEAYVEIKE